VFKKYKKHNKKLKNIIKTKKKLIKNYKKYKNIKIYKKSNATIVYIMSGLKSEIIKLQRDFFINDL